MTAIPPRRALGVLLVAGSAVGYGFMPIFAAYAYRAGLNVATLLFLRFTVAAVLFAPVALLHDLRPRRTPDGRTVRWRPRTRDIVPALALGAVLYTAQAFAYFTTMRMTGPGLAAVLLYLYPGIVALAAAVLGQVARTWRLPVVLAVGFLGVALASGPVDGGRASLAGIGMGVLTAMLYASYILIGDRVSAGIPTRTMAWLLFVSAAAAFGVVGAATGGLRFGFAPAGWWAVVGLALACTIGGIWLFFAGLGLIGATAASLVSMLECVTAIVASVLILGETMSPLQWVGAAVVLAAAVAGARLTAPLPD